MSKVFIVTGAASGIGFALTQQLLARKERVCACDINLEALEKLRQGNNPEQLLLQKLDVRSTDEWTTVVDNVLQQWNGIDVLCNVAGILRENWVTDITEADVNFHFDINVKGTIFGTQVVLPTMLAQKQGHIINIASLAALSPVPGLALYSASKFAVRGYSLAAGMELAEHEISVTTICPDAVQTPMLDQQKGKEQAALTFSGSRALTTQEVVDAILEALEDKPLEVILPPMRGVVAKVANAFPALAARQVKRIRQIGIKRQQKISQGADSTKK
ncbi:SDR family NAD(P)-dependent oxidoreductase [Alkanindiges sp. WGS2144]|uniref:SDR family NAD(P)-dependent oxidoreductase n=1 Tax=Alkanindiges sp. WGS2144 TaxID=3366808 RepID=UPI00375342F5